MNRVELSGRLTRDPEIRYVGATDFPVATLNLAVDDAEGRWNRESRKTELNSGFYRIDVAGDYGRSIAESLNKGDQVYVVGSLQQYTVGGKEGSEKQTKTQIKATFVQALSGAPSMAAVAAPADPLYDDTPF